MRTKLAVALVGIALVSIATPIVAHHSFSAEFDASKPFKMTGTVTKVEWMNPHTFFYIDVTDEQTKKVTNWAMEMGSPNGLMRNGWKRDSMKEGDLVVVEGSLAKDGSPTGRGMGHPRRPPHRSRRPGGSREVRKEGCDSRRHHSPAPKAQRRTTSFRMAPP